jgi:8-oxo-dGTP pyrophosphatase MutT (NUDIX family)
MQVTESAGGIVLNALGEVTVVSQKGDSWSLPKGHVDPGETPREAAEREVREETGITQLVFVRELGSYERYRIGKDGVGEDEGELKRIHMFLFRTTQQALVPEDPMNPEARWVPMQDVANLVTHPKDKEFFEHVKGLLSV